MAIPARPKKSLEPAASSESHWRLGSGSGHGHSRAWTRPRTTSKHRQGVRSAVPSILRDELLSTWQRHQPWPSEKRLSGPPQPLPRRTSEPMNATAPPAFRQEVSTRPPEWSKPAPRPSRPRVIPLDEPVHLSSDAMARSLSAA